MIRDEFLHPLAESGLEFRDATVGSPVPAVTQTLDHPATDVQRHGRADECRAEQAGLRCVVLCEQARAHLAHLADGDDVHVLAEVKLLEVEHLAASAERLNLVNPDTDAVLAALRCMSAARNSRGATLKPPSPWTSSMRKARVLGRDTG